MKIAKDMTVCVEYILKNSKGEVIDSSKPNEPLEYIHGYGTVFSWIEDELEGKDEGESFDAVIPPEKAYGEVSDELITEVSREQFPDDIEIKPGMEFETDEGHHSRIIRVKSVSGDKVVIDANHPLAGETLSFYAKVISVRKTSEDELNSLTQMLLNGGCCCGHEDTGCGGCSGCH